MRAFQGNNHRRLCKRCLQSETIAKKKQWEVNDGMRKLGKEANLEEREPLGPLLQRRWRDDKEEYRTANRIVKCAMKRQEKKVNEERRNGGFLITSGKLGCFGGR